MLEVGAHVPDARVWVAPREDAVSLRTYLGSALTVLCFYLWDWSPT